MNSELYNIESTHGAYITMWCRYAPVSLSDNYVIDGASNIGFRFSDCHSLSDNLFCQHTINSIIH